jgi:hypothetical protein
MQSGQHDYIRDLYRTLTDIGEEADKTVDARFVAEQKSTAKKTATPAVKVTPPPLPGAGQRPRPQPVPSPVRPSSAPGAPATSLSVNPFSVVGAALSAVMYKRAAAFWLGAIFVLAFGLMSTILVGANVQHGTVVTDRGPLRLIALAAVVYLLCWWIRMGGNPRNTPFTGAVRFADIVAAVAIGAGAYFVLPVFERAGVPRPLDWAAYMTRNWWPLHGPYASMALAPLTNISARMPVGTAFWEPFTQAVALVCAFPLIPFIARERTNRGAKTASLLLRAPVLVLALMLCTLPVAVVSATLADWIGDLVRAQDTFAASLIMAAMFYVQLVISGATIGEFYRRVSVRFP